jgi:uncharacterized protein (TIGR02118 family)
MTDGPQSDDQLHEWSRHYDTLIWVVIVIAATGLGGTIAAGQQPSYQSNPSPEVVGILLTLLATYWVASFRCFRHRLHGRLTTEPIKSLLQKSPRFSGLPHQWATLVAVFAAADVYFHIVVGRKLSSAGSPIPVPFLSLSLLATLLVMWRLWKVARPTPPSETRGKVLFVLFRRSDLTHEQALTEWSGPRHTSIVGKVPGLRKWVQNHVLQVPSEAAADGIGELWFDSTDAMDKAMISPQMAGAVEDAKRFLDMQRTYALIVDQRTVMDQ